MTKDFATFDCDGHVTEPPLIRERAHEFLTRDELDAKQTIWWDAESRLWIVNGRAGIGLGSPRNGGIPGTMRVITNAGRRVKHDIQRPQRATLWVSLALMSGFFDRHPKINAAVFEASSTWLSFLLDECDKAYRLYRNERQLPPFKHLPSETFAMHCMTGFEGDEAPPARLPGFYGDILAWSSDVYHHDGEDAWRAIETMQKHGLPIEDQPKFLGDNAPRLYKVQAPAKIIRDRVTEIECPNWSPTEEEIPRLIAADGGGQPGLGRWHPTKARCAARRGRS